MMWTNRVPGVSTLLFAFVACAQCQTFNIYQGGGVLENAWNDWSWCTDNLQSTAYKLSGSESVQVTYTAGWQGFSLESNNNFEAGYFSALSFYINGGPHPNRSIIVQLTVNGQSSKAVNLDSYIEGGHVPANAWAKVTIPLSAFSLKSTDQISRFWLQESSGSSQPPFWLDEIGWVPVPAPKSAAIELNTAVTGQTISPLMFGANTAIWDANLDSTTCKGLIAEAGFKGFRFPGGSASDGYNWATNKSDNNTWQWATNFDTFAAVAAPNKGQDVITTNYGTGTAAEAAAWVKYANVTHKYGMKYWEVGNEVYGGWEEDAHALPHDPVTYAKQFALYYTQMKAIDPTILVGAVSSPGEDAFSNYPSEAVKNPVTGVKHSGWTPVMLATLANLKVQPDFIVYHRYPEYVNDCDFTLLAQNTTWYSDISNLRQQLNDYCGVVTGAKSQIFCTETNADAGTEGKQMCSLVNGLFMADSFGTALQTECKSMIWWDLINGINTSGDNGTWLYGWRLYGDEGVFSPDFTKIYPVFYIEQILNDFAAAGDKVTGVNSSYNLLTAYATKRSDGSARLLVVNKNPTTAVTTTLKFVGIKPASGTVYVYGMPNDDLAKAGKTQYVSKSAIGKLGSTLTYEFQPYSVTVIAITPASAP